MLSTPDSTRQPWSSSALPSSCHTHDSIPTRTSQLLKRNRTLISLFACLPVTNNVFFVPGTIITYAPVTPESDCCPIPKLCCFSDRDWMFDFEMCVLRLSQDIRTIQYAYDNCKSKYWTQVDGYLIYWFPDPPIKVE